MSNYEKWLESELAFRKQSLLNRIDQVEHITAGLRQRVNDDSYLNDLGELQVAGVMLDTAVAAYATQRQALKNYREMEMNTFLLDGITYRVQFNELNEIGGCCQLDGSDFQECCDCVYEGKCPADGEEE
jgi:hypothetical protein